MIPHALALCSSTKRRKEGSEVNGTLARRYPGRIVHHSRLGVWDWYEEQNPDNGRIAPSSALRKRFSELIECVPYLLRTIEDVLNIPGCRFHVVVFTLAELGAGLIPALSLWFQGELLQMMEVALTEREVNAYRLLFVCAGRIACTIATMLLEDVKYRAETKINCRIRRWFAQRSFRAYARLDVPTFSRHAVQDQLASASEDLTGRAAIWESLRMVTDLVSRCTALGAQTFVLFNALKEQRDGPLLALTTAATEMISYFLNTVAVSRDGAWAVTTRDANYLKMKAWSSAVRTQCHRKEIVTGNLADYAISEYKSASEIVGDDDRHWSEIAWEQRITAWGYIQEVLTQLPQIAFTLRAIRDPRHMPGSLAALNLVQSAARGFVWSIFHMCSRTRSIGDQLIAARGIYDVEKIPNEVQDGTVEFPESAEQIKAGISIEFRDVSFKYPDSDRWALRHVSFALLPRQLCVIVGSNGAGKSTILKLIARLYDPEEGEIFICGRNIRCYRLYDLRQAISVLFQDYTHFPLSIRDNIALGDPSRSGDDSHVRLAARLSGADSFIETLPDGFNTYLKRPVPDQYSGPPEGYKTHLGNTFDVCAVRDAAGLRTSTLFELSGGQMQRLAVARTFMRSIAREDGQVGLLLFDEPSASLDPAAEHDLFERLRRLRGNKTMVFSTHRFGNLTRHADLILYMHMSGIVESGSHDELLSRDGEYAGLWKLQAQAFA